MNDILKQVSGIDPASLVDILKFKSDAADIAKYADAVTIETPDDERIAADVLAKIRLTTREMDDMRDATVRPFNELVKRVNALFKGPSTELAAASATINSKVIAYRNAVEQRRRDAFRAEQERIDRERAERDAARREAEQVFGTTIAPPPAPTPPPPPVAPPNVTTSGTGARIHTRRVWKWRVVNPGMVPPGMCSPDPDKLDAALRSYAAATKPEPGKVDASVVSGVEFYVHETIVGG